jgi:hypothetical protein
MKFSVTDIGKYKIEENESVLRVRYKYTLSDLISILLYIIGFAVGVLFTWISISKLSKNTDFSFSYLMLPIGFWLLYHFGKLIIFGLYNPSSGILSLNLLNNSVTIRDSFKKETFQMEEMQGLYVEVVTQRRPKQLFGMLKMKLKSQPDIDCFIIRSNNAVDERKAENEIYQTAAKLRERIMNFKNKNGA